ncbi:unnamed protein product [Gongylonema pulchrum]|uniref:Uncharacterized protein n=1 Tax=Gongylonema pulchrum TaxID=637853 RepID=A0A183DH48_9BILA|nr:unnamed protein product [Gongylonema pulchrum]
MKFPDYHMKYAGCSSCEDSPEPLTDHISPKLNVCPAAADVGSNAVSVSEVQLFNDNERKCLELSVDNEDELPPTLEADGAAKTTTDQNECILGGAVGPFITFCFVLEVVARKKFSTTTTKLQDTSVKEWEKSEKACGSSAINCQNEMPLLRVNVGGNESTYEGEDEDAPPRLSPNFALVCISTF